MLSLCLDQFEFEDSGSEEALETDAARQSRFPHPDVASFVGAVIGIAAAASLPEPKPFFRVARRSTAGDYLRRFAQLDVPPRCDWPTCEFDEGSWDEVHLVICGPGVFIRYRWSATA